MRQGYLSRFFREWNRTTGREAAYLLGVLLAVSVLISYGGTARNGFIDYDDPAYVTENRYVQRGLGVQEVVWAFTTSAASNWHPLTWLSLMADRELFGMYAGGYHWTNVVLHLLSTLVLFAALLRMTGRLWCSALVAGLFAVHPLHVESVAWVAERKDVLSGLFWMLGLWGYARYAERPGLVRYGWVVFFFLLGLLSKPMVVTFPFVLLLLDFWPLERAAGGGKVWSGLVREKIPLFLLSAGGSVITFLVQREGEAITPLRDLSLIGRLTNAVVSYAQYLVKTVFPANLTVFYPHPGIWPVREVILSLLLITLITIIALLQIRRRPYLPVGWFWYLGMLVPVIGLVQVGAQAMADRYTYLPLIGVFIMVIWSGGDILQGSSVRRAVGAVVIGGVLTILVMLTQIQVGSWKDTMSLFTRALQVTDGNYQAHNVLGNALAAQGKYAEAVDHFREAIRITPYYMAAYNNLGKVQMTMGDLEEADASFSKALRIKPGDGTVHFNRGELLIRKGLVERAIAEYRKALQNKPYDPQLHNNLGVALTRQGHLSEAIAEYREAIRLDPHHAGAHYNVARLLESRGLRSEAVHHLREALRYRPDFTSAHDLLALLLKNMGQGEGTGEVTNVR